MKNIDVGRVRYKKSIILVRFKLYCLHFTALCLLLIAGCDLEYAQIITPNPTAIMGKLNNCPDEIATPKRLTS